ncbi:MAG TPA: c-type cytochrome [Burkholderiaceae bacterium]|nr:c-type cytochrome [Burkholderiaceae bacterium]
MKTVGATLAGAALLAALAAAAVLYAGVYDVSASTPHTQFVYSLLETAQRQSVRVRARSIEPPLDRAPPMRGAACFKARCEQCHGGPGVAPEGIGMSMQPVPGPLIDASRNWRLREVYWITRNGVKMTGMPAWQLRMSDADIWAVAEFVMGLSRMSPADYAKRMQVAAGELCSTQAAVPQPTQQAGDARRGREVLTQYACRACHLIPGVTGADVHVGPPLGGLARRTTIAGTLPNTADQLEYWIRDPHGVDPRSAMPDMGVSPDDARDIAAYLMTLH